MGATFNDVNRWIETAKQDKNITHIISVCDTFDYDDYPVYCEGEKDLYEKMKHYGKADMQRINEVIKIK